MIEVKSRAQCRAERAGDPLDGLVNMFDLGIVLAVAFLIAALQSHNLTQLLTDQASVGGSGHTIVVPKDRRLVPLTPGATRVAVKGGLSVGQVYQLPNGLLVYVKKK